MRTEITPTEREYDAAANARASELDAVPCEQHAALVGAAALSTSCEAEADVGLSELDAAHKTDVQRVTARREALRADIEAAKIELDVAVNAPVSGGSDPTESLPDELMEAILLMLPFATLWSGACERVCRRWKQLIESALIVRRKREKRWAAYEAG